MPDRLIPRATTLDAERVQDRNSGTDPTSAHCRACGARVDARTARVLGDGLTVPACGDKDCWTPSVCNDLTRTARAVMMFRQEYPRLDNASELWADESGAREGSD